MYQNLKNSINHWHDNLPQQGNFIFQHIIIIIIIFNPHPKGKQRQKAKRKREREREKYLLVVSCMYPTGDQTSHLGMCPDGELSPQSFGVWDDASTNQATRPELNILLIYFLFIWKQYSEWYIYRQVFMNAHMVCVGRILRIRCKILECFSSFKIKIREVWSLEITRNKLTHQIANQIRLFAPQEFKIQQRRQFITYYIELW